MLDTLALELVGSGAGGSDRQVTSLIRAVPARSTLECVHFELKRGFSPDARGWAELSRDIVALANSKGGVILLGVEDDGSRLGLETSLLQVLDPARVIDQLRRKAPSAAVSTAYREVTYYRKVYGALVIQPLDVPLVFDTEWGYNTTSGEHRIVIKPGLLYVRTPGKSAPARQADVRELWQQSVDLATERVLARIERVASLPLDSELIITDSSNPDSGHLLLGQGKGQSVRIVSDPATPAIPLREVLATDAPYASVASEVASQVRNWQQADPEHVVSKHALIRWWLQREELTLDHPTAEFCLRSATHTRGYATYWASVIELARLREILELELAAGSAIPCQAYAYIAGLFFWDERDKILREHQKHLSPAPLRAVEKVLEASSYAEFLTSVRWSARLRHASELITMAELVDDRDRGLEIYAELLRSELAKTITQSEAAFARQLDLVVHAPH